MLHCIFLFTVYLYWNGKDQEAFSLWRPNRMADTIFHITDLKKLPQKRDRTILHFTAFASLMMEAQVRPVSYMSLNWKIKTLHKEGSRAGWLYASLYHCYQTLDPDRAALSGSQHFCDPASQCMNSTLSGSATASCKQYEIIAIII